MVGGCLGNEIFINWEKIWAYHGLRDWKKLGVRGEKRLISIEVKERDENEKVRVE